MALERHDTYPAQPPQQRNSIAAPTAEQNVSDATDAMGVRVPPVTDAQMQRTIALAAAHLMKMLKDQAFDYTHPVDEYAPQGMSLASTTFPAVINVQPDYDMPEKIENILAIVPVGTTLATLQLGQRTLFLYSGAALTTPLVVTIPYAGVILNSDDPRTLTLAGVITSCPYLGLTGWALTRGQFS